MGGGAADRFWAELRALYEDAGGPTLDRLVRSGRERGAEVADSTISGWLTGQNVPTGARSVRYFMTVLIPALTGMARRREAARPIRAEGEWRTLLKAAQDERRSARGGRPRGVRAAGPGGAGGTRGPVTLPADPERFTGRASALGELMEHLDPARDDGGPPVAVVSGMGGVGKTALVTHAARRAHERGWFPGGVLFEDVRGYGAGDPVDHGVTAARLLRALGTPAGAVPAEPRERVAALRDRLARLAEHRRPVLVVLDNAVSAGQAAPLSPGPPHRMLVTSRNTLAALAARRVPVRPFPPEESVRFLDRALRTARPGDDRVAGDPAGALRLAELCGHLPLALRVVVALLRDEPDRPLAGQAADLAGERTRIGRLRYDDVDEEGRPLAVEAAFDLSYRHLVTDPERARAFRLLARVPGPDTSLAAAAVVLDRPAEDARRVLAGLARMHLLEKRPGERWGMHDLVRLYAERRAGDHADDDRSGAALDRLFGHYHERLGAAGRWLRAPGTAPPAEPDAFASRAEAVAWLDAESRGLVAAVTAAHESCRWDHAFRLATGLADHLEFRHQPDDAVAVGAAGLEAARRLGRAQECAAAMALGNAYRLARRYDEAIGHLEHALELASGYDDRRVESSILHNLGLAHFRAERFAEAESCHRRDLEICQEDQNRRGAAEAMVALGDALRALRRFREAAGVLNRAVEAFERLDDPRNVMNARTNLALTCLDGFSATRAAFVIWQLCLALKAARDLDDRHRQATILVNLTRAYLNRCRGCHGRAAVETSRMAAGVFAELGDDFHRAHALLNTAKARWFTGEIADARRDAATAAAVHDGLGEARRAQEARALLAETAGVAEGTVPAHTGCPGDGDPLADVRRAWLDDLPHAVLRGADGRLREGCFIGDVMIGPTPDGSALPDEVLARNGAGLFLDGEDLTRDEAVGFLRGRTRLGDDEAWAVAAEVGGHPDVLDLAAAHLRRERLTATAYLERLREAGGHRLPPWRPYPRGAVRAAVLAIESLERGGRRAAPLGLLALLSPGPLDRPLVHRAFPPEESAEVDAALDALVDAAAISVDETGTTIAMSSLMRDVLVDRMSRRGTLLAAGATAVRLLAGELAGAEGRPMDVGAAWGRARQVGALWETVRPALPDGGWDAAADLMRLRAWRVTFFASAGHGAAAVELGTALLEDCERLLGGGHRETWRARNNLAGAYAAAGDHDRACALLARNAQLSDLAADDPDALLTRHNLGAMHLFAGRPKRAARVLGDVLADRARILGGDHPQTLETCRLLGVAQGRAGSAAAGVRLLEDVRDREKNRAAPSTDTLVETLDTLAGLYAASGRVDDAVAAWGEGLALRERSHPAGDGTVLVARNAVADRYAGLGRFDDACRLLERNLTEIERAYGAEERLTRVARRNLEDMRRRAGKRGG